VGIVIFLEQEFGIDFSDINFDAALLDSIDLPSRSSSLITPIK